MVSGFHSIPLDRDGQRIGGAGGNKTNYINNCFKLLFYKIFTIVTNKVTNKIESFVNHTYS